MKEIIRTKNLSNYCRGCNNQVELKRFIQFDECQTPIKAWEERNDNLDDDIFCRTRFMGFCHCGKIWLK